MSVLGELEDRLDLLRNKRDQINEEIASIHKDMKQYTPSPRNMKNVLFPIVRDFHVIVKSILWVAEKPKTWGLVCRELG
jgi:hypothetical protein